MAEPKENPRLSREDLKRELELSRQRLDSGLGDLRDSTSVRRRLRHSFDRHSGWWIGGGLLAGYLIARPRIQKGDKGKKRLASTLVFGLLGGAAKQILRVGIPLAAQLAGKEMERRLLPDQADRDGLGENRPRDGA